MKRLLWTLMLFPFMSAWAYASQMTNWDYSAEVLKTGYVSNMPTSDGFDSIMDKLENQEGVESLRLSPKKMLSLIAEKNKGTDEKLFSKMDNLMVLSVSKSKSPFAFNEIEISVKDYVSKVGMDQVLKLKEESGESLQMYHLGSELIFLTSSENEFSVIYIRGTIDRDLMSAVMDGKISFK